MWAIMWNHFDGFVMVFGFAVLMATSARTQTALAQKSTVEESIRGGIALGFLGFGLGTLLGWGRAGDSSRAQADETTTGRHRGATAGQEETHGKERATKTHFAG